VRSRKAAQLKSEPGVEAGRLAVELPPKFLQDFLGHTTPCTSRRAYLRLSDRSFSLLFRSTKIVAHLTNLIA